MQLKAHLIDDQLHLQTILDLGCLEMRRSFQNMKPNVLDKKINFEYLEKDVGLKRFFPENLLNLKYKTIKKLIVKGIKENENHNEEDCMLIYLEKLKSVWNYYEETFNCFFADVKEPKVICLIISYDNNIIIHENEVSRQVLFKNITKIELLNSICLIHLTNQPILKLKFPSLYETINFALLIDGYCMLLNGIDTHIWQDLNTQTSNRSKNNSQDNINESLTNQFNTLSLVDLTLEIQRKQIELIEKLGSGQFGDVYKGVYKKSVDLSQEIAIKMLKLNELSEGEDPEMVKNKFMQEASKLTN